VAKRKVSFASRWWIVAALVLAAVAASAWVSGAWSYLASWIAIIISLALGPVVRCAIVYGQGGGWLPGVSVRPDNSGMWRSTREWVDDYLARFVFASCEIASVAAKRVVGV
jgi:hypothetical protein